MIKHFRDGGRWILTIEPVGDQEQELIKQILQICGLEDKEPKSLQNVLPPTIPTAATVTEESKPDDKAVESVGKGYQKYLETVRKIKNKELAGEEKATAVEQIKKTVEVMKTKVPKGANLRFCIENMADMFSQRIENTVLDQMHISKEQLMLGDEKLMTDAYKIVVSVI